MRRAMFAGLLVLLVLACAPALARADGGGAVAPAGGEKAEKATKKAPGKEDASAPVVLKRGDRGSSVRKLQDALGIAVDGVFGAQTERAVKRFQKRKGLTPDGVVGPQTRDALGLAPFAHGSVNRSSGGSKVKLPAALKRIAECESGGNPKAVSPSGLYRGKYQFSLETWQNLGGKGDPIDASEATQDRIALKLYRRSGTAPWPSCG